MYFYSYELLCLCISMQYTHIIICTTILMYYCIYHLYIYALLYLCTTTSMVFLLKFWHPFTTKQCTIHNFRCEGIPMIIKTPLCCIRQVQLHCEVLNWRPLTELIVHQAIYWNQPKLL